MFKTDRIVKEKEWVLVSVYIFVGVGAVHIHETWQQQKRWRKKQNKAKQWDKGECFYRLAVSLTRTAPLQKEVHCWYWLYINNCQWTENMFVQTLITGALTLLIHRFKSHIDPPRLLIELPWRCENLIAFIVVELCCRILHKFVVLSNIHVVSIPELGLRPFKTTEKSRQKKEFLSVSKAINGK